MMKPYQRRILSLLPEGVQRSAYQRFFQKEHSEWITNGKPLPVSNLSKQEALIEYQKKYSLTTLVETGTYLGDTLFAMISHFKELYSIELSDLYHSKAKKRFAPYKNVHLLLGDSGKELHTLVPKLMAPALFWLDGHYSGGLTAKGDLECPVYEELRAIFGSPLKHVIFIDDARLFVGKNDYPTLAALKSFVAQHRPELKFSIVNDCIRLEA